MTSDGTDGDATDRTNTGGGEAVVRKLDSVSESLGGTVEHLTPDNLHVLRRGVKVTFAVALTVLFAYWGVAYLFDVMLFEF